MIKKFWLTCTFNFALLFYNIFILFSKNFPLTLWTFLSQIIFLIFLYAEIVPDLLVCRHEKNPTECSTGVRAPTYIEFLNEQSKRRWVMSIKVTRKHFKSERILRKILLKCEIQRRSFFFGGEVKKIEFRERDEMKLLLV